ncbi:hypothetical protein M9H77_28642 [Catharanthus roseus]|uniref:Uncharacterized protein n=1 Tax=Catharanthus roseus TaxID=4058 RepID=A0ACC0AI67_CATRO|nr:hypothetical protein M9H77_28642 [Catharanthus roseus]
MTLLDTISKASTGSAQLESDFDYPIILNPDPVFLTLKPENEDPIDKVIVKRVSGWDLSQSDSETMELGKKFFSKLKRKLKNTNSFTKGEFFKMFNSYLEELGGKFGISVELDRSDEGYTNELVGKVGGLMGRDVRALILEGCVVLEIWDLLESLIVNGLVEHSCTSNLVNNLIEKRRSDLIILCVKHFSDLQSYDIMCILKYFLCPPKDGYGSMVAVRKEWDNQALLAIQKVQDKSLGVKRMNLAKDASLLIMLAHDGFSVSQLCLHYLLASKNLDEVILASCISKLNGSEMMCLIRYLSKWLKKYERFPRAIPSPEASSKLGLTVCVWIPSIGDIVKCLGLVMDEHFSSLVFHLEVHEELRSLGRLVNSLAAESRLCSSVASIVESWRTEH